MNAGDSPGISLSRAILTGIDNPSEVPEKPESLIVRCESVSARAWRYTVAVVDTASGFPSVVATGVR